MSPSTWDKVNFFESIHIGKKNKKIDLGVIDEELQNKILDSVVYDDEYDDSYDEYLTAVAVEQGDPFFIQNPNKKVPKQVTEGEEVIKKKKEVKEVNSNPQPKEKKEITDLKERKFKDKNKAKVGNHNRKKAHDKKVKF
jgi:hypothetical protein